MGRLFLKANVIYTLFLDFISKQIYLKKSDFFYFKNNYLFIKQLFLFISLSKF